MTHVQIVKEINKKNTWRIKTVQFIDNTIYWDVIRRLQKQNKHTLIEARDVHIYGDVLLFKIEKQRNLF